MLLNCHWIPFFLRIWNKTKTVFWFCSYEVVDLEQWIYMFLFLQMPIELQYKTAIIKSLFRIFLDNKCEWPDTQGIYFKSVVVDTAVVVRYWESYPILSFYANLPSIKLVYRNKAYILRSRFLWSVLVFKSELSDTYRDALSIWGVKI